MLSSQEWQRMQAHLRPASNTRRVQCVVQGGNARPGRHIETRQRKRERDDGEADVTQGAKPAIAETHGQRYEQDKEETQEIRETCLLNAWPRSEKQLSIQERQTC